MVVDFINYNLLVGGLGPSYGQNSDEFSVDFRDLEFFRNHIPIRWVRIIIFQTGYDIIMPCRSLVGFPETETHSRTHCYCHVSTFGSGRDNFIDIRAVGFLNSHSIFMSLMDIDCIPIVVYRLCEFAHLSLLVDEMNSSPRRAHGQP